jgi:hypothetical protein
LVLLGTLTPKGSAVQISSILASFQPIIGPKVLGVLSPSLRWVLALRVPAVREIFFEDFIQAYLCPIFEL